MAEVAIKEGLFVVPEAPGENPRLIGSRCGVCGYTCFPKKQVCVKCRRDDTMEELKLGPFGILENFAVMQVGTPEFSPHYIMGYVRMKEGALVFTTITGCEPADNALRIGDQMELVIEKIREDDRGNDLLGWKFKPLLRSEQ